MSSQVHVPVPLFDNKLVRRHSERAARMVKGGHPLLMALAEELADRLLGIRHDFSAVLQLGGLGVSVAALLPDDARRYVVLCDSVAVFSGCDGQRDICVVADGENLPFGDGQFDLVISLLGLAWIHDVQKHLHVLKRMLRPGGLFLGAMAGGETFASLRSSLMEAELALRGGAGSRFSPMIDMTSASRLLLQAGFKIPVVDKECCTLTYRDIFAFVRDLRALGATAAHHARAREWLPRDVFAEAERLCRFRAGENADCLTVQAELFFLHGWQDQ